MRFERDAMDVREGVKSLLRKIKAEVRREVWCFARASTGTASKR